MPSRPPHISRRSLLAVPLLASLATATACGEDGPAGPALAATAPLPTAVPTGTRLVVGDPQTQQALKLSGQADKFSFAIEWANISGGPKTLEAFRADALDVGAVADIPPLHATWTGVPVRIVASRFRKDPLNHPTYEIGIAPGSDIAALEDLRGKKIAYSPGQAQGALVLRVLRKARLRQGDVDLVELPSTGDVYPNALSSRQVDAAPLGGVNVKRYLTKFGGDGARTIRHGLRDDPWHLYVRTSTLEDAGKAAAIREFVQRWALAAVWVYEHPAEWIAGYWVKDQGVSVDDGRYLVDNAGEPDIPASWAGAIQRHQETVDLLAKETKQAKLTAADLYDRRFEKVAAEAVQAGGSR